MKQQMVFGYLVLCIALPSVAMTNYTATGPVLDAPALNSEDGSIRFMNHDEAKKYCEELGTRLPTPRELAMFSIEMGAKGILETSYPDSDVGNQNSASYQEYWMMSDAGYQGIGKKNASGDGISIDFFFNADGYKSPTDIQSYSFVWSSAINPANTLNAYALAVNGTGSGDGSFFGSMTRQEDYLAVRCIKKPDFK